jgi:hypothetical protein
VSVASTKPTGRRGPARKGPPTPDGKQEHLDWLSLTETTGPFLTLPVLLRTWPNLDALDTYARKQLRAAHADWLAEGKQSAWIEFVLRDLLDWRDDLKTEPGDLADLTLTVVGDDQTITPSFVLGDPKDARLLGLVFAPGTVPTERIKGDAWSATPVDRIAQLCRHQGVELGLVTDGRWWALVWAPRGGVTTSAVFDAITWPEVADRIVVRAFLSLLRRKRFFAVPEDEQLPALLKLSGDQGEEVTENLGTQVRQAVELLVDAIGRAEHRLRAEHGWGLDDSGVTAHDVYRGAVAVMMRIVFLLFAEEHNLLPSDNELYTQAYSAGRLCEQLEERVRESSEEELEHSTAAWHRLLALFRAVYGGVEHSELTMHAYDGSIFDPDVYPWLEGRLGGDASRTDGSTSPLAIDDRTVYHMLLAVQYVQVGTGRARERRKLTFRALDVEQIGYVYEGLLSFEGFRAPDTVVGLVGKPGAEEEVALAEIEDLARPFRQGAGLDADGFAEKLAVQYKDSSIGTAKALAKRLAPLDEAERKEAVRKLHASTGDADLVARLLPFAGIIREDLRGLPVVIRAGALYVTESRLRSSTGTHYTPRFLAEQVAKGALEPLVYEPGPLQTADTTLWKLKSSEAILRLKVADIAMGSAAFLVAACRYLGDRLLEAWSEEGSSPPSDIEAYRQIIEHCLYGVDINPMAVEMAKLSLWLVSMDPSRPFTFLDDRLVAGDSLLGITSIEQLEFMNLNPDVKEAHRHDQTKGVRGLVNDLIAQRDYITALNGDTLEALADKRRILAEVRAKTKTASMYADLVVGAALSSAGKGAKEQAKQYRSAQLRLTADPEVAERTARDWLATDQPEGGFDREPIHWPLVFPEVFALGGFDAIIGNPPFLGGLKIADSVGAAYRELLVEHLAKGVRGNRGTGDLVAYFVLRAHRLIGKNGQTGLIATNTLAQGDTRQVGLDQVVAADAEIRQAVKSEPWPSKSAVLEYCAIWTSSAEVADSAERLLEGVSVRRIASSLDAESRASGLPYQLVENSKQIFQGSNILGLGFTMEPEVAKMAIENDSRNSEVLFPYLNGQDLNQNIGGTASRWVINFHDWSEEKASTYPEWYNQVRRLVKPERENNNQKARRERWWRYSEYRRGLVEATASLDQVVVLTLVSKVVMPMMVPTGQVFAHKLAVFASDDTAMLALLSSAPHYWWAITRSSTLETRTNYSPTDVFETFARPELTEELRSLGDRLDTYRRDLMLARQSGLTSTYNLAHDEACTDADIVELREIHRNIDYAVAHAYGWDDLVTQGLDHGHHDTRQGPRYTVGPIVRQEILDRLLELNHTRYAAEQAADEPEDGALF